MIVMREDYDLPYNGYSCIPQTLILQKILYFSSEYYEFITEK